MLMNIFMLIFTYIKTAVVTVYFAIYAEALPSEKGQLFFQRVT